LKVTTKVIYRSDRLCNIEKAEGDLKKNESALKEMRLTLWWTPPALSDVLLAVHNTDTGLVTITRDLSVENPKYTALRPEDSVNDLDLLWKAFCKLLEEVLIPLAMIDIIHPDIRPGYEITSNILVKIERINGKRTAVMKLIDFESIVNLSSFEAPMSARSLYISKDNVGSNAQTYLWWQCVAVAYAWKEKKFQKAMNGVGIMNEDGWPDWLTASFDTNNKVMTKKLATNLEGLFETPQA